MVPDSVMPPYRALFDGAPDRPRQEARDLVAYLESLGRARELDGPDGEARAREGCNCPDDAMAQMAFGGHAQRAPGAGAARARGPVAAARATTCRAGSSCSRATAPPATAPTAQATAPGASALRPRPTNLAEHDYSDRPPRRRLVERRRGHGHARMARPARRRISPRWPRRCGRSRRPAAGAEPAAAHGWSWERGRMPPTACSVTACAAMATVRPRSRAAHGAGQLPAAATELAQAHRGAAERHRRARRWRRGPRG